MGIESTELHSFKSPCIIDPRIYKTPETVNAASKKVVGCSQLKKKIISCYACKPWIKSSVYMLGNRDFKKCPYCQFDFEGNFKSDAEAVIFFPAILGERLMPNRPTGQIWIMAEWESPVHFNYPSSIAKNKNRTVAWFVSNCKTQSKRMIYVKTLQKYVDIDIIGRCGTKKCSGVKREICERALTTTYKFYLSFENSFCEDYVTEKLFRSYVYRAHVIPVTRGALEYHKYIPPGGFVDTADFKSPKELGLYLRELGNDTNRYVRMLKEKDKLMSLSSVVDWCNVCEKLHTRPSTDHKVIPDIKKWSHQNICFDPSVYVEG